MQQGKRPPQPVVRADVALRRDARCVCGSDDVLEQNEGRGPRLYGEEGLLHHPGGHGAGVRPERPDVVWEEGQQR